MNVEDTLESLVDKKVGVIVTHNGKLISEFSGILYKVTKDSYIIRDEFSYTYLKTNQVVEFNYNSDLPHTFIKISL